MKPGYACPCLQAMLQARRGFRRRAGRVACAGSALGWLARRRQVGAGRDAGRDAGRADAQRHPDLAPVAKLDGIHHHATDQLIQHSHHSSPPSFLFCAARARTRYAIRLCKVNSSMNPGLAAWLNSPPDSPNEANERSYSAWGELRATGPAEPL